MKRLLIIVDPNNDFVDSRGSLYIKEAEKGVDAIIDFIEKENPDAIIVSQDTHETYHISHCGYWKEDLKPFTVVTVKDVEEGRVQPLKADKKDVIDYLKVVENKHQTHTLWPEHCIKNTWGWEFPERLNKALQQWQSQGDGKRPLHIYEKGEFEDAEMFSIFSYVNADEVDQRGKKIMDEMAGYDEVVVCGFAKDYCVAESVKDIRRDERFKNKLRFMESGMYAIDNHSPNFAIYKDCVENFGAKEV